MRRKIMLAVMLFCVTASALLSRINLADYSSSAARGFHPLSDAHSLAMGFIAQKASMLCTLALVVAPVRFTGVFVASHSGKSLPYVEAAILASVITLTTALFHAAGTYLANVWDRPMRMTDVISAFTGFYLIGGVTRVSC